MIPADRRTAYDRLVGARIRSLRTTARMKQTTLARKVGVSNDLVSLWERGRSSVKLHHLPELAAALNVTVYALVPSARVLAPKAKITITNGTPPC